MLSYIHAYHAGNHADILKHLTLSLILEHLCQKEKPFCVIDTHAGSGLYNLHDERAKKTEETKSGIEKIIENKGALWGICPRSEGGDFPLPDYFSFISNFYNEGLYPGSPLIENLFLRPGDQQILCELHPAVFEELKNCFYERKKTCKAKNIPFVEPSFHKRDCYEFLGAVTPPKIKRGLVLVDPSFEEAGDFEQCGKALAAVHKKWSPAILALWYPLVAHRSAEISMMKEKIISSVDSSEPKILDVQLEVKRKEDMTGLASLYGSGMLIVNFPYKLDEELEQILPVLSETLGDTAKNWSVDKL